MENGNGTHRSRTWQDVANLLVTLAYRLVALYLLRDLLRGQEDLAQLILTHGG